MKRVFALFSAVCMLTLCLMPLAAQSRSRISLGTVETFEGDILDVQVIYPKSYIRLSAENGEHIVLNNRNIDRLIRILEAMMPLITDESYTIQIYTEPRIELKNDYEQMVNRLEVFASTLPGKVHFVFYSDDAMATMSIEPDQVEELIDLLHQGQEVNQRVRSEIEKFQLPTNL